MKCPRCGKDTADIHTCTPEIIRMAREAKLPYYYQDGELVDADKLIKFAALIAAAEREACARVADKQDGDDEGDVEACIWSEAARHIAAAIRARGEKT